MLMKSFASLSFKVPGSHFTSKEAHFKTIEWQQQALLQANHVPDDDTTSAQGYNSCSKKQEEN